MVWGKQTREDRLKKIKQLMEEEEKEKHAAQQETETPIVESSTTKGEGKEAAAKEIEEQVKYYNDNYRGLFNPSELPIISPMDAETNNLLFGILQELRKIKDLLK